LPALPAGAVEAGLPYSAQSLMSGQGWLMSWLKTAILVAFVGSAVIIYRPWCRIFCPLGGWLALFNRWSLFHLRFHPEACVECNLCRSRCPVGVKVDQKVNVTGCIRCLECTTCGAVRPAFALPGSDQPKSRSRDLNLELRNSGIGFPVFLISRWTCVGVAAAARLALT